MFPGPIDHETVLIRNDHATVICKNVPILTARFSFKYRAPPPISALSALLTPIVAVHLILASRSRWLSRRCVSSRRP